MAFTDLLHQSANRSYGTFSTGAEDNSIAVDAIQQTLLSADWVQTGDVKATAEVLAPFGLPYGDPPDVDGTNVAICSVNGKGIRWVFAPAFPPVAGWINLAPGMTQYESAQTLAAALEDFGFSVVITAYLGGYRFQMTATALGTAGNGIPVGSVGIASWYAGSGLTVGGGWILRSSSQADLDTTSVNATRTKLTLTTASGAFGFGSVRIYIEVDSVEAVDFHTQKADWKLAANNYSAMFMGPAAYHAGDEWVGSSFLFCGSLFVPQALTGITGVGFVLTGPHCQDTLGQSNAFASANTAVNAKQLTGGGFGQHGFSFAYYHYQKGRGGADNLQTREEKSVLVPALVMMPATPLDGDLPDDSRVVGYLWDAFIDTSYQKVGTVVAESGQNLCARLAQADGAIGTLFTCTDEPAPEPTWSGVVNATFFEVDWVSGDLFDSAMEGKTIELGTPGVAYTVSAVSSDNEVLSITTAYVNPEGGNSATNIAYSV